MRPQIDQKRLELVFLAFGPFGPFSQILDALLKKTAFALTGLDLGAKSLNFGL